MSKLQAKSFDSPKKFFDDVNFARGFHRSGDFTRDQAQMLENMGVALKALQDGTRTPVTDEEQRFVEFAQQTLAPTNAVERTWATYINAIARKQIYFTASSPATAESDSETSDNDDS